MQLALPRCLRAWALQAAAAAAAWSEKEVDAPRGAGERFGPSPVQAIVPQTQAVKGQATKGQISRGPLVKGYSLDNSSEGWFGGGSASPSTEPAGASSSSNRTTSPLVSYSRHSVFSQSTCHSSTRCPIVRCLSSHPSRLFCIRRQRRSVPNISQRKTVLKPQPSHYCCSTSVVPRGGRAGTVTSRHFPGICP